MKNEPQTTMNPHDPAPAPAGFSIKELPKHVYRYKDGFLRWQAPKKAFGFKTINLGRELTRETFDKATALNAELERARKGIVTEVCATNTFEWAFRNLMKIKEASAGTAGEATDLSGWYDAWYHIGPAFGHRDPKTIDLLEVIKFRKTIATRVSEGVAHKAIIYWWAIRKHCSMVGLCHPMQDATECPIANPKPKSRTAKWSAQEVERLISHAVKTAPGLALQIAIQWDSLLSPGDVRTLRLNQLMDDPDGWWFLTSRKKTGKAVTATLSPRTEAMLVDYLAANPDITEDAPFIRTTGGWRWTPRPYGMRYLSIAFEFLRAEVFGPDETRTLADLRRSGAMEARAGDADYNQIGGKLANEIAKSVVLRRTYTPEEAEAINRQLAQTRRADDARQVSRATQRHVAEVKLSGRALIDKRRAGT